MTIKIKSSKDKSLRNISVGEGLPDADKLHDELQYMLDVLLDRAHLPIDYDNTIALMEIADAYYTRGCEIQFRIHALERRGVVKSARRNSKDNQSDPLYLFRTGELASFLDACKRAVETGSRRLSARQYEAEQTIRGLTSSWGG